MTAAITEPTYLSAYELGICLHSQARFRFGKYKGELCTKSGSATPNIFAGSAIRTGSSKSSKYS
jgi:hypothetical protein